MTSTRRAALVMVRSFIRDDPRPRRQVDWLAAEDWDVDTVALGEAPDGVRDHFSLVDAAEWTRTRFGRGLFHALLPDRVKFRLGVVDRIPAAALDRIRRGAYDLVVLNDLDFVPLVGERGIIGPAIAGTRFHLDIHEYFPPHLPPGSRLRIRVDSHHRWVRRQIADRAFGSRSVVSSGIAEAYADELGIPRPEIVWNAPPFVDLEPTPVQPGRIRMVHHGVAKAGRGLPEIVRAMELLDDRFEMTFMLVGGQRDLDELAQLAAPLGDRVRIVPPVRMRDLPTAVNGYDLEIMLFPPTTKNLHWVLPNKLFEAVQGRLGLVIGPSPMMVEIIDAHANGVVAAGFTGEDLAAALAGLTEDRVAELKRSSDAAAPLLSAEHQRDAFLRTVGIPPSAKG